MKILFSLAIVGLILISCEPEDDTTPSPTLKANLAMHFDHKFGADPFELDKEFVLGSGNTVKLSFVRFYISGITMMDDTGIPTPLDEYLLFDQGTHLTEVAEFVPQHVHKLRFNVGVDSAANHTDPTTYPSGHPLSPQSPSMHWSWATGYIFYKLEGEVDTTGDGIVDAPFEFHIGLDEYLRQVSGLIHKDVEAGDELTVDIKIDYQMFFDGIDLTIERSAHGMDNPSLSKRLADNVPKAFSIE